ncbi:Ribonuclease H [Quillaja saponaria]|uniref:Ribonuclease H n=1 Tax=Quillaja saponaria TaxID=32244 RepID=A0AAD7KQ36_QUISA|nr:Ribonuclease H [Quillaja saponaria]
MNCLVSLVLGQCGSTYKDRAQVGSSICDPPVSVYKGYSLPKETEEYLVSRGLKNALYTIRADDLKEDIFNMFVLCPFQDPAPSRGNMSSKDTSKKKLQEVLGPENVRSCILEFDGGSSGNPGQAGAGVVLRADDGNVICRLREGLGVVTCNAAEYRALILGLKYALKKGFTCIHVQGLWKVKHKNMSVLYKEAKELKDKFLSFQINHVLRNLNSEADAQANLAKSLADGQVQEEFEE